MTQEDASADLAGVCRAPNGSNLVWALQELAVNAHRVAEATGVRFVYIAAGEHPGVVTASFAIRLLNYSTPDRPITVIADAQIRLLGRGHVPTYLPGAVTVDERARDGRMIESQQWAPEQLAALSELAHRLVLDKYGLETYADVLELEQHVEQWPRRRQPLRPERDQPRRRSERRSF